MGKIITNTEKETWDFAKKFAKTLSGGEIIALQGNLGAGKTTFTKGLANGLGVEKTVSSPTFVIMKVYPSVDKSSKVKKLVHIDAYRLQSEADLEAIGAIDYFQQKDTVTVIEWAEKIKGVLPKNTKNINIIIDNKKRIIQTNL